MSAYDTVTDALHRAGCKQRGHDWTCPFHKNGSESNPSLSVNEGARGVVMTCQAGCDNTDVLRAVGLTFSDLFDEPLEKKERKQIRETYDYTDSAGNLIYQVVRYEPKEFRQRTPDGNGGWKWTIKGVKKVPYHLPELLHALSHGTRVFIVEGEKDVHAIERAGGVATCNSGGAGKWPSEFAKYFEGADVVIVSDADEAGAKHAAQVLFSLGQATKSCDIVKPKIGKDAADHLAAGYDLTEFLSFDVGDDVMEPLVEATPERVNPLRARLLDIDDIDDIPPPTYLIEDLIVSDALAVVYGLPGSTKSFITIDWALHIAHGKEDWLGKKVLAGPVLYIVAEGLSGIGIRKKAWRKKNKVYSKGDLKWLRDPVNLLDKQEVADLIEICDELQPVAVFVDTLARSMPGADENAPAPMSEAIEALDTVRRVTRAAVVAVHHTPKDGSSPRGHSALLGAVQTAIKISKLDGVINLSVEKQKDGQPIEMGLSLVVTDDSAVIGHRDAGSVVDVSIFTEKVIERTLIENAGPDGLTNADLLDLSGLPKATFFRGRKALIDKGRLVQTKQRRWTLNQ